MGMNRILDMGLQFLFRVPRVYGDEPFIRDSQPDDQRSSPCVWG